MNIKATLSVLALSTSPAFAAQEPLNILATVGMIGDIAAQIGGDCVAVNVLVGPGADPHLFTPAPSDLAKLQKAEVLLYGGLHLEGQLGEVLEKLSKSRPVIAVSEEAIAQEQLIEDAGQPDPHIWMDASLWAQTVPVITEAIQAERPDCPLNDEKVSADLMALHDWTHASLASIPKEQRHLITAHDAFTYFGRAYDVEVSAIQGISTQSEASIADIDAVAELIAQSGIPAVFVESTINPRTIQALTEAVSAKGGRVDIGGALFADSTEEDGSYINMIRHNIETIVPALGGTLAPLPEALK